MSEVEQDTKGSKRGSVHRSPAYPGINLKLAIEKAQAFYMYERRAEASVSVAVKHWGYAASSSGGKQILAALISYGLMEDRGNGEHRQVRLTDLAFEILLDERPHSAERDDAIRRAALLPKIHAELFAHWSDGLPSTENVRHYLLVVKKFNDNSVDDFIKQLRITADFAKIYAQRTNKHNADLSEAPDPSVNNAEGLVVANERVGGLKPAQPVAQDEPPPTAGGNRLRQDTFTLDEGQVVLQWPANLSEASFEDMKDWLDLQMRKIRRGVQTPLREPGT
jgi:hypothetical protein